MKESQYDAENHRNSLMKNGKKPPEDYVMPKVLAALLPGGYRYLRVRKPGIKSSDDLEV